MFETWSLSGLSFKEVARRVWREINKDDVFGRAAQLAYYFLLALFPLLLFLMTLLGYFAEAGSELRNELINYLGTVVPSSSVDLIHKTIEEITTAKSGSKLSFGLLAALWAASNGMGAISATLNIAYEVEESRPWWKVRLVSIMLTILLSILIIAALILVLYGGKIAELIAATVGFSEVFTIAWKILQWPIVFAFLLTSFSSIYYFAPDKPDKRWQFITPGAVLAVVLWLIASLGFRLYLHFFDSYSATYGSLGALIILMLWFYLTGVAILIGGELNSELEFAAKGVRR